MKSVFLSYARADSAYAIALAQALEETGTRVFFDHKIQVGDDWDHAIQTEIDRASVMVVLVSEAFLRSQYVHYETGSAISAGVPVLPVMIGDAPEIPYLRDVQSLDARGLDPSKAAKKISDAVRPLLR